MNNLWTAIHMKTVFDAAKNSSQLQAVVIATL